MFRLLSGYALTAAFDFDDDEDDYDDGNSDSSYIDDVGLRS